MTQIRRTLGDYVSSKFLNSAAVAGQEGPAVITAASEQEVRDDKREGGKRLAILVYFDRWPEQGLDLNATNIRALQDMFGEDIAPDDLRGRRVYVGTHQTNFGRGVLLSPCPDSVAMASSAARQRIANARSAQDPNYQPDPLPTLALQHSHDPAMPCSIDACDVARAISLGHPVNESWPAAAAHAAHEAPAPFVPRHQPPAASAPTNSPGAVPAQVVGTGPQARRVEQPPAGPAAHGANDAPPGAYHEDDPGAGHGPTPGGAPIAGPIPDDDIPF